VANYTNTAIKKPNQITDYTPAQIKEMKKCAVDPIYFIEKYIMIQHPTKGCVHFKLHGYQKRMIQAFQQNRNVIMLASRQVGKSTVSSAYLLWYAIFNFDKTILIVSNKNDNAMEMVFKIQFAYENLPHWLKPGIDGTWTKHSIEFDNKTRILSSATTANSGRGLSISLLFADELAFVDPTVQEDFWTSISPTLSTGGSCIIASTPNGDNDVFATLWRGAEVGSNGYFPIHIAWDEPPGRDEKFRQIEIAKLGELKWKRDYECQFLSDSVLLIDPITVANMIHQLRTDPTYLPVGTLRDITFWKTPEQGKTYLVGLDPSTGTGTDFSVIEVFEFPSMEQVAEYRTNTLASAQLYGVFKNLLNHLCKFTDNVFCSLENNGIGEGMLALYDVDENPSLAMFIDEEGKNRKGFTTTEKPKNKACSTLQDLIRRNEIKIKSRLLVDELKYFIKKGSTYRARTGSTDDCISALLIVIRIISEIASYDVDAYNKLYSYDYEEWGDGEYSEFDVDSAPSVFVW
jgi:hypothetical protein